MHERPFNLAIETTTRQGSVTLGCEDRIIDSAQLASRVTRGTPSVPRDPGNRLDLMPTIDMLARRHDVHPKQLGEVYISTGPGSFTGLRIAIATAKAMALTIDVKLVAVSTLEAITRNVPVDEATGYDHLAVCLNLKRQSMYTQVFVADHKTWTPHSQPELRTLDALLDATPRPLAIIGDPIPDVLEHQADDVVLLPPELAMPKSTAVWKIGHTLAKQGRYTEAENLTPQYARPPEAQELWDKRHGTNTQQPLAQEAAR